MLSIFKAYDLGVQWDPMSRVHGLGGGAGWRKDFGPCPGSQGVVYLATSGTDDGFFTLLDSEAAACWCMPSSLF